jgi:PAS domain S-box-containing protein
MRRGHCLALVVDPTRPPLEVLQSIIDNAAAVIFIKHEDGRYLLVNRRFEELFHVSRREILGKADRDLFSKEQADVLRANDLRVLREDRPIELDEAVTQDDGLHQYISLKFPLHDPQGHGYALCGISTDVTQRKRESDELRRSHSLLEATLESTADGILVVDRAGNIVRFNRRFATIWSIPEHVLASNDDNAALAFVLDQLAEPDLFLDRVRELYGQPEASSFDVVTFRNGRVLERYSQPQRAGGEVVGRVWSFRDVTDRVRAEEHRDRLLAGERRARAEAEEAVRVRDEFLSVASHELRTPLASLSLAMQGLEHGLETMEPSRVRWAIGLAARQVKRLGQLVDTLLDVSRIHAGKLEIHREDVDLAAIARDVATQFADEAARHKTTISVDGDASVVGSWDGFRLEQIVTNLVSNALKFGEGRPVSLSLTTDGTTARLVVRDRGVGIRPEVRSRLFERFSRGVSARHYGGLGLGLYITRVLVEAHGGRIDVTSEPGEGSSFIVELPVASKP